MSGVFCFDIEATGLLDDSTVDYCASPWRLKDNFKIHCIVAIDVETGDTYEFVQEDCYTKFPQFAKDNIDTIIGANIINYDLLVLKAACGMNYTVGPDTWCGKPVKIIDTLILSKTLNPDRKGHSIEYFGEILGEPKIDWRGKAIELGLIPHNAPRGAEFQTYHPEMLVYNRQDVIVNIKAYHYLMKEWGDWPWEEAFQLEQAVAEIITRQSHRGFWFDKDLAIANIKELDTLMEECRSRVEPNLPEKPMGKTKLKEYIPCKNQFLKNGKPNSNIEKWVAKHGGTIVEDESGFHTTLYGKSYTLPIPQEPIMSSEPSSIEDTTFIKGILVEMGWHPSSYKERDLTLDTRKQKLSQEKFIETVERYVEQTLSSPFVYDRCERVNTTPAKLRNKLLGHDIKKPLKVYTNPTFTVGQEKELDPTLEKLYEKFPYVEDIVHFLTYRHRRNSILGGGMDYDEWEEDDDATAKGFLANVRADGRIPTPADTCGAGSGRFLHRIVVNVPRVTSIYGAPMRSLFGIGDSSKYVQFAWDFMSLEARAEAHYCWRYDEEDHAYCNSLLQEKPNDVHSVTARKISSLINKEFPRSSAKNVKYACVPMHTKALTRSGWKGYDEIQEGEEVLGYDKESKTKKWTKVLGKFKKEDEVIEFGSDWFKVQATKDHRWFVKQRKEFSTGKPNFSIRRAVDEVRTTSQINSETSIIVNAPMDESQDLAPSDNLSVAPEKYGYNWTQRVLNMSQKERVSFLEGFMVADGYYGGGRWQWDQNHGEICDAALVATYLVHDKVVCVSERNNSKSPMKAVILSNKAHRTMSRNKMESKGVQDVWCIETELGSWVMKQGNTITITGNCTFGAQSARIAKTIGCDLTLGQEIYDAFWEAALPLAKLKEAVEKWWQTKGGKKFIPGLDGRKINTRSQHALLNSLFQSCGVICSKRTMVYQERLIKEAGLSCDFWVDDWQNKLYVQQLAQQHDEVQMEMSKSLIKWKKFESDEDAKEFCSSNNDWVGPLHFDGSVFCANSPMNNICKEAVRLTNEHYKLNIDLAVDPTYGRNWCETH